MGADKYITKPFDPQDLLDAVENLLNATQVIERELRTLVREAITHAHAAGDLASAETPGVPDRPAEAARARRLDDERRDGDPEAGEASRRA